MVIILCFDRDEVDLHNPERVVIAGEMPQIHWYVISGENRQG